MDNQKAISAWVAKKARIDAMLTRLQAASDDHFNIGPEEINWGHVGDMARVDSLLKEISDSFFREGEYAPENTQ